MKTIKCLSIKQPFAEWILQGIKVREHRSYPIKFRGIIVIHSSMKPDTEFMKKYGISPEGFKNGHLLGIARITEQIQYGPGDYAWLINPICFLKTPIFYKGKLGLWDLDIEEIKKQIPDEFIKIHQHEASYINKYEANYIEQKQE